VKKKAAIPRRTIDQLRKHVPGKWRYEWPSRWVHESGVAVQGYSSCKLSETGFETYFTTMRRTDTGEVVHPLLGAGLATPFVPLPPPKPGEFTAMNESKADPPGCECPTHYEDGRKVAKKDRCAGRWIRCNARVAYVRKQKLAELAEAVGTATAGLEGPDE